jgi:hypothetical protein
MLTGITTFKRMEADVLGLVHAIVDLPQNLGTRKPQPVHFVQYDPQLLDHRKAVLSGGIRHWMLQSLTC